MMVLVFNVDDSKPAMNNGLYNIRERVSLLRGSLEIYSEIGKGSVIKAKFPIEKNEF